MQTPKTSRPATLRPRERADVILALVFVAISFVQIVVAPIASVPAEIAIVLGTTLPLAWRRQFPAAAALFAAAVWIIPSEGFVLLGYVTGFLLFFSCGAYLRSDPALVATGAAGVVLAALSALTHVSDWVDYLNTLIVVVGPIAVGRFVRQQRDQNARLRELTLHLEHERERSNDLAVAEERARIARELHDVVAHGLSVIAIQADAAEAALDADPDRARGPVAEIKQAARASLSEMRGLLGLLREDDHDEERAPLPGLAQLPALIERSRVAGLAVELNVSGDPREIPQGIDLAAYRIIQESLTNVRKHANSAPTTVALEWDDDQLRLAIRDRGPGAHDNGDNGHGLIGMRERTRAHGGTFRTEGSDGNGFAVLATLPLEEAE
jgi:signal transduction histidine kinase